MNRKLRDQNDERHTPSNRVSPAPVRLLSHAPRHARLPLRQQSAPENTSSRHVTLTSSQQSNVTSVLPTQRRVQLYSQPTQQPMRTQHVSTLSGHHRKTPPTHVTARQSCVRSPAQNQRQTLVTSSMATQTPATSAFALGACASGAR